LTASNGELGNGEVRWH